MKFEDQKNSHIKIWNCFDTSWFKHTVCSRYIIKKNSIKYFMLYVSSKGCLLLKILHFGGTQNRKRSHCTIDNRSQLTFLSIYSLAENKQPRFRCLFLGRCMNPGCLCCVTYCIYLRPLQDQMVVSSLVLRLFLSLFILSPSARCPWVREGRENISLIH